MKTMRTKVEEFVFYFKKGDKVIGERIALRKYEKFESFLIKNISKLPGIAIDIGANIGYYSLILSKMYPKVMAFEPEPTCFALLEKNTFANGIHNITMVQKAISDKPTSLSLDISKTNFGDHQIKSNEKGRKRISILSTSLDAFIKEKVSLLKIDTQGWEPKVISGAEKLIERDLPTIFMEFWPEGYKRSNSNYMKMIRFLEKHYGRIFLIDDNLNIVYPIKSSSLNRRCKTEKHYLDLLFIKKVSLFDRVLFVKNINIKNLFRMWFSIAVI